MNHPLLDVFEGAARGEFPPVDGGVTFLAELDRSQRAIVAFTGHAFIAADVAPEDLRGLALDGFGAALMPEVVLRVADGGAIGVNDVILVAPGTASSRAIASGAPGTTSTNDLLPPTTLWDDHPRVRHARHLRRDVEVRGDRRGFVTLATGLAGRREVSIEIDGSLREPGSGAGRDLLTAALDLVPDDRFLFVAVSPGNARSLRAFLAAGFVPIGSEIIIDRSGSSTP